MSVLYRVEDSWCRYLPLLHRLLADPLSEELFPPAAASLPLNEACAVWETLHYLLCVLLGWDDPGTGLSWWYAHGKPVADSPLLAAVSRWWGRDEGALDLYAAWAWEQTRLHLDGNEAGQTVAPVGWYADAQWWKEFRRQPRPAWHNPYHGGSNPLHLGHSDSFGFDEVVPNRASWHLDASARQAFLIVNHLGSWRRDLLGLEKHLPAIGERSWHVEVFDRQTGYLGLFRRSRETGRWFQGKHSVHVQGKGPLAEEVSK